MCPGDVLQESDVLAFASYYQPDSFLGDICNEFASFEIWMFSYASVDTCDAFDTPRSSLSVTNITPKSSSANPIGGTTKSWTSPSGK